MLKNMRILNVAPSQTPSRGLKLRDSRAFLAPFSDHEMHDMGFEDGATREMHMIFLRLIDDK